jgi:uncharacterized membrane protein YhaH (DUF805 family)
MGALRAWFSFKGRISRKTWWVYSFLSPITINVAAALFDDHIMPELTSPETFGEISGGFSIVSVTALLLGLCAGLAGQAKRWRDLNKSGWWGLVSLIAPLVLLFRVAIDALGMWWYVFMHSFLPVIFSVLLLLSPSADEATLQLFNDTSGMGLILDRVFLPALFVLLIYVWLVVVMVGCVLSGTTGPNRFVPDQLAPPDAANIALPPSPQ